MIVMQYPTVENVLEMPLSQRDEEIQTLPADRSNYTLANSISLGRPQRRTQYAYVHGGYGFIQFLGKDTVPVVDEEVERMITRKSFAQLLLGPLRAGVIGDVDVQDLASAQFHENEHIKDTESGCHHDEEVTGHYRLSVIAHEGEPTLAGIGLSAGALGQILADRSGRNPNAQLKFQFVDDVFLSPGRVLGGHLADQRLDVFRQTGPSCRAGLPPPK